MVQMSFTPNDLKMKLHDFGLRAMTSGGRTHLCQGFAEALRKSKIGGVMLEKITLMYHFFRDPAEPWKPKLLIGGALLYLVIPNDLIPDVFPMLGFTDDFAALTIVWNVAKDVLCHYDTRRKARMGMLEAE